MAYCETLTYERGGRGVRRCVCVCCWCQWPVRAVVSVAVKRRHKDVSIVSFCFAHYESARARKQDESGGRRTVALVPTSVYESRQASERAGFSHKLVERDRAKGLSSCCASARRESALYWLSSRRRRRCRAQHERVLMQQLARR